MGALAAVGLVARGEDAAQKVFVEGEGYCARGGVVGGSGGVSEGGGCGGWVGC